MAGCRGGGAGRSAWTQQAVRCGPWCQRRASRSGEPVGASPGVVFVRSGASRMWAIGPASSPMKAHAGRSRRPGDGVCDVTSAPAVQNTTSQATADPGRDACDAADRLRLKADTTTPTGQVDGGWWPHSTDLAAELPDLFSVLVSQI